MQFFRRRSAAAVEITDYSDAMIPVAPTAKARGLALALGWRRVLLTLGVSVLFGVLNTLSNSTAAIIVVGRTVLVGLLAMLAFGLFEQWPARPPGRLPRWALQLVGVVVALTARCVAGVLADDGRSSGLRAPAIATRGLRNAVF